MKTVRILIADDHEVVREGMRLLLDRQANWEVCGVAKTGRDAVEQAKTLQPDIVVLDMGMPELNGLEAARQIKGFLPTAELLIFTGHEQEDLIREVFDAGVKSYILKGDASSHLVDAVRALSQHKPFFTTKVSEVLFAKFMSGAGRDPAQGEEHLTKREREIIQLIAEGASNKEVAQKLGVSLRTAETHRANVLRKLNLSSVADLVRYAIRNNIVQA
jgi:two-component system, NarL family, response regulator NreC